MPLHLGTHPKHWPEAWLNLIDALADYIEADKAVADDMVNEARADAYYSGRDGSEVDEIVRQRAEWTRERDAKFGALLNELRAHEIDPTLYGLKRGKG